MPATVLRSAVVFLASILPLAASAALSEEAILVTVDGSEELSFAT